MSRRETRLARLDPIVAEMYRDYQAGLTLHEVAVKYRRGTISAVYHLFKVRGLPRRRGRRPQDIASQAAARRARLDALASEIQEAYVRTRSLKAVARAFGSDKGTVRYVLQRNGYTVRPFKTLARQANGAPVRYQPKTEAEIEALICAADRICVPIALRFEWRTWPDERRAAFIARLRARLASPLDRPLSPFSADVEPFDFFSPSARAIAARLNAGRSSRDWPIHLRLASQGVIWRGELWFWSGRSGDYQRGPWTPDVGRHQLRRTIWQARHGRPVPEGHVVRAADGNKNNLSPDNLVLATRNDVARENQAAGLQRKSRERTALLLSHAQNPEKHDHLHTIHFLRQVV